MSLDVPTDNQTLHQQFILGGWAFDSAATSGNGVDYLVVYAQLSGTSTWDAWGIVSTGGYRSDVGAAFGHQFDDSGFGLNVARHTPGTYSFVVYPHSSVTGQFDTSAGKAAWNVTVLANPAVWLSCKAMS